MRRRNSTVRVDVAAFCMPLRGHFNRLAPIISGLTRIGSKVDVYTHQDFRADVQRCGARFRDLFSEVSVEDVDAVSIPTSSRYVSFAGSYATRFVKTLENALPRLIIYDSFAVIGWVVARLLDLPCVCICAGHNRLGSAAVEARMRSGPVSISTTCDDAVDGLHRLGLTDVSPFSYLDSASRHLNVYCEPPNFLMPSERAPFEPIEFYGSLDPSLAAQRSLDGHPIWRESRSQRPRIYVSFGTAVWDIRPAAASKSLQTVCAALEKFASCDALISLGSTQKGPLDGICVPSNVQVERYVDQWRVLSECDLFVTHQGLNSTHEAIFHSVPMVSQPFFGDQPALARRCQDLLLSTRLADVSKHQLGDDEVREFLVVAMDGSNNDEACMRREAARQWEVETMNSRPAVLERILSVAR